MSGQLIGPMGVVAANSLDAATAAWVAAVVADGGTVSGTQQSNVDTLIKAYKTAGVWTLLDREWLFASENAHQAKIDIVGLASLTLHGTPNFTANFGYDNAGSSANWIDTGFGAATTANFTVNAASFGCYIFTSNVTAGSEAAMGATPDGGNFIGYIQPLSAVGLKTELYGGTFGSAANPGSNHQGNYLVSRTSSTNIDNYRNAAFVFNTTDASSLGSGTPTNIAVLGFSGTGTLTEAYNSKVVSSVFMGGSMNSTKAAAKNAALNAYMTAVGANVY